jgi:hypothetical protein
VSGTRDLCRQCGDCGALMPEEAEACFDLPSLWETAAHFACRNARSAEAEMGGADHGNTHLSIDTSTDLGMGFLPFFSKQGGKFLQQSFGFFAEETIRGCHKRGKVPRLLGASLKVFLLFLAIVGC